MLTECLRKLHATFAGNEVRQNLDYKKPNSLMSILSQKCYGSDSFSPKGGSRKSQLKIAKS